MYRRARGIALALALASVMAVAGSNRATGKSASTRFLQTNLVSDIPGLAAHTDPHLVNPWGVSHSATSPFWVSNADSGTSTLYNTAGTPLALVVTIPNADGTGTGSPTGQVFNGSPSFELAAGQPARFIFATEEGTIAGWNPATSPTTAVVKVDNGPSESSYKGLAIGTVGTNSFLYAADFHNARIDVFGGAFQPVTIPGGFQDSKIPQGYAPFNVQNLGGKLYVAYAKQDDEAEDEVAGQGFGFVDVYDTGGNLLQRLLRHGQLNAPWGLAIAPASFGEFANTLLVGNFGDGEINVYDPATGDRLGQLRYPDGKPVEIDGLWALIPGNGGSGGSTSKLYFSAGIDDESHGLFGSLEPVAGP